MRRHRQQPLRPPQNSILALLPRFDTLYQILPDAFRRFYLLSRFAFYANLKCKLHHRLNHRSAFIPYSPACTSPRLSLVLLLLQTQIKNKPICSSLLTATYTSSFSTTKYSSKTPSLPNYPEKNKKNFFTLPNKPQKMKKSTLKPPNKPYIQKNLP